MRWDQPEPIIATFFGPALNATEADDHVKTICQVCAPTPITAPTMLADLRRWRQEAIARHHARQPSRP